MKTIVFICFFAFAMLPAFADEIPNTVGAVKAAKPGDYIVLKDGSHYVLVEEEIAIVNGTFDYNEVEVLKENEVPRSDGGVEFNITTPHKRIVWPDGKSMDIFTTRRAFDAYVKFLGEQYDFIPFTNYGEFVGNSYPTRVPQGLRSFRGKVYRTFLTNGVKTFDYIEVKEFNRTAIGDGIERNFQVKGGTIVTTLSGGGNLSESGVRRDE
jgi:hypothetical protein